MTILIRFELCDEAIRLGRLMRLLMPDEPEVAGLLALMLLQDSRKSARVGPDGDQVLLEDQGTARCGVESRSKKARTCWKVYSGLESLASTSYRRRLRPCIAKLKTPEDTDWQQIVLLYDATGTGTAVALS